MLLGRCCGRVVRIGKGGGTVGIFYLATLKDFHRSCFEYITFVPVRDHTHAKCLLGKTDFTPLQVNPESIAAKRWTIYAN